MPQPFSRTLRSLEADSRTTTLVWIILALSLLLVWSGWFFFARITRYEDSNILTAADRSSIEAEFPAEAMHTIRPGQHAFITLAPQDAPDMADAEADTVEAVVAKIPSRHGDRPGIVRLFLTDVPAIPLSRGQHLDGKVAVATGTLSPFKLVMQASGLFTESAKIRLSPRQSAQQRAR